MDSKAQQQNTRIKQVLHQLRSENISRIQTRMASRLEFMEHLNYLEK